MLNFVDTLFNPILEWTSTIREQIMQASIPLSRSLDLSELFAPYSLISPQWSLVITTGFSLAFVYSVIFIVSNSTGLLERFRNVVKWW